MQLIKADTRIGEFAKLADEPGIGTAAKDLRELDSTCPATVGRSVIFDGILDRCILTSQHIRDITAGQGDRTTTAVQFAALHDLVETTGDTALTGTAVEQAVGDRNQAMGTDIGPAQHPAVGINIHGHTAAVQVADELSALDDAGDSRRVCPGQEVTLGRDVFSDVTYSWDPAKELKL